MLLLTVIAAASVAQGPRILATMNDADVRRIGMIVELVERPAGIPDAIFAQDLIDREGLRPWNGAPSVPTRAQGIETRAVFAGDGREIIVKYVATDGRLPGKVCRLRSPRGGWSNARWSAYRWCAVAFGVELPASPPPPIVSVKR